MFEDIGWEGVGVLFVLVGAGGAGGDEVAGFLMIRAHADLPILSPNQLLLGGKLLALLKKGKGAELMGNHSIIRFLILPCIFLS
jgi:hypothetical protein